MFFSLSASWRDSPPAGKGADGESILRRSLSAEHSLETAYVLYGMAHCNAALGLTDSGFRKFS